MKNPYNPSFGRRPERFLGREHIIEEVLYALDEPNSPWRSTLLIGIRGSGKTALLSDIGKLAKHKNVVVASVTPEGNLLDEILVQIYRSIPSKFMDRIPKPVKITIGGITEFDLSPPDTPSYLTNFRYQISTLLDELKSHNLRTLILLDETQKHSEQMRTFISTFQHLVREEYQVNLVMAGLPHVISDILNDDVLTFFRRSNQVVLQGVELEFIRLDYYDTFHRTFQCSKEITDRAAELTKGYPYLIQLIGFYLWRFISDGKSHEEALDRALSQSKAMLYQNVHSLLYHDLSKNDKDFVNAMIEDEYSSKISDIQHRLSKTANHVSTYRNRLISNGYIRAVAHGEVDFMIPYTKDYIKQIIH